MAGLDPPKPARGKPELAMGFPGACACLPDWGWPGGREVGYLQAIRGASSPGCSVLRSRLWRAPPGQNPPAHRQARAAGSQGGMVPHPRCTPAAESLDVDLSRRRPAPTPRPRSAHGSSPQGFRCRALRAANYQLIRRAAQEPARSPILVGVCGGLLLGRQPGLHLGWQGSRRRSGRERG